MEWLDLQVLQGSLVNLVLWAPKEGMVSLVPQVLKESRVKKEKLVRSEFQGHLEKTESMD